MEKEQKPDLSGEERLSEEDKKEILKRLESMLSLSGEELFDEWYRLCVEVRAKKINSAWVNMHVGYGEAAARADDYLLKKGIERAIDHIKEAGKLT